VERTAVPLPARDVMINRAKASIKVVDHPGPGGSDGELNFTFSGPPRRQNLVPCTGRHNVVKGALNGTIRIRIGDRNGGHSCVYDGAHAPI
jgi:hypothetical protein